MVFVTQIKLKTGPVDEHPFSLPTLASLETLTLDASVTFFVGGNGTGKSTLLEGVAASTRLPGLTGSNVDQSPLMASGRRLATRLTLVKAKPVKHGFFFRADDVTGFLARLSRDMSEFDEMAGEFAKIEGEWGRDRAMGMAHAQRDALQARYGEEPFAKSHGELFLELFQARINAPGLYLLDEPETPLSPENQIAFLALLAASVAKGSQFVIATHSPIIMAAPQARIYNFDACPPQPAQWDDLEHVQLTRAFLNHPEAFLRHLDDDA